MMRGWRALPQATVRALKDAVTIMCTVHRSSYKDTRDSIQQCTLHPSLFPRIRTSILEVYDHLRVNITSQGKKKNNNIL